MREQQAPYPAVGQWYRQPGGELLEVVAIDEDDGTIDVQHFDGTVEELDLDAWLETGFEGVDAPEDYSGSLDLDREAFLSERGELAQADDYLGFADRAD